MGAYQGLGRLSVIVLGGLVVIGDLLFLMQMSKDVFG